MSNDDDATDLLTTCRRPVSECQRRSHPNMIALLRVGPPDGTGPPAALTNQTEGETVVMAMLLSSLMAYIATFRLVVDARSMLARPTFGGFVETARRRPSGMDSPTKRRSSSIWSTKRFEAAEAPYPSPPWPGNWRKARSTETGSHRRCSVDKLLKLDTTQRLRSSGNRRKTSGSGETMRNTFLFVAISFLLAVGPSPGATVDLTGQVAGEPNLLFEDVSVTPNQPVTGGSGENEPTAAAAPEPYTWGMLLVGFVAICALGYKRGRKNRLAGAFVNIPDPPPPSVFGSRTAGVEKSKGSRALHTPARDF